MPRKLGLKFLGFNNNARAGNSAHTELNTSLREMRQLEAVDSMSDVAPEDFCEIANEKSTAWAKTYEFGPYDVINIDLCDGFGKHPPASIELTHYNALDKLLTFQARHSTPWLLLLTTRAGEEHIHIKALEKFIESYARNLSDCPVFQKASSKKLKASDLDTLKKVTTTSKGLLEVFLIGLSKWLAKLATAQLPPTKVEMKSIIGYRVVSGSPDEDLISLAFRFIPTFTPAPDPGGLEHF